MRTRACENAKVESSLNPSPFDIKVFLNVIMVALKLGRFYTCDFFLAPATQRFKFHRIAGASEVVTRAMEFVVRQY